MCGRVDDRDMTIIKYIFCYESKNEQAVGLQFQPQGQQLLTKKEKPRQTRADDGNIVDCSFPILNPPTIKT